jgi:hypothetical protein
MFLKLIILSVLIVAVSLFVMSFRIIFSRRAKFPVIEIGKNPQMKKLGIRCPRTEEALISKGKPSDYAGCVNCSLYNGGLK